MAFRFSWNIFLSWEKNVILLCRAALKILVSWLRIEPVTPVLGAWTLNHWTPQGSPSILHFFVLLWLQFCQEPRPGGDPFLCVHSWCCICQWDPFYSYAAHCHQGFHPFKKNILFRIYFRTFTQSHRFLYQLYLLSQLYQFACPPTICERASHSSQKHYISLFKLL